MEGQTRPDLMRDIRSTPQTPEADTAIDLDIDGSADPRMAKAIGWLSERWADQPSLEEVAAAVGMSPFHFQRRFTEAVGVSPKKYVQFLTLGHAKLALRRNESVLDAAYDAGLSGPSRRHDLFIATRR